MGVATHRGTYSPFSTAMHDLEKVNQHEIFFLPKWSYLGISTAGQTKINGTEKTVGKWAQGKRG